MVNLPLQCLRKPAPSATAILFAMESTWLRLDVRSKPWQPSASLHFWVPILKRVAIPMTCQPSRPESARAPSASASLEHHLQPHSLSVMSPAVALGPMRLLPNSER